MGKILDIVKKVKLPCSTCNDSKENWLCLKCGEVHCSRYIKGHFQNHYENTGHSLGISLTDLSVWCYKCEDYINNPHIGLRSMKKLFEEAKFPPNDPKIQDVINDAIQNLFS